MTSAKPHPRQWQQLHDEHGQKTYRRLDAAEFESLKRYLNAFSAEATKIDPEEIDFKKGNNSSAYNDHMILKV